jgi:hypothetical protein
MASYPARKHTRRGIAIALQEKPPCGGEQPDSCCPCDACCNYFAAQDARRIPYSDLTNGAQ